jgi:putative transcriptional regulator
MEEQSIKPGPGVILIAHPWLSDPNFQRTVVLLCQHEHEEGSFGVVLSRKLENKVGDLVETLSSSDSDLFLGGPVQPNTLHYLHRRGDVVDTAIEVQDELFWGGDFDLIQALVLAEEVPKKGIRFFAGYSGWGPGQLAEEIEEGSWILTTAPTDIILETESDKLWKTLLRRMGGEYGFLSNFPLDPRHN